MVICLDRALHHCHKRTLHSVIIVQAIYPFCIFPHVENLDANHFSLEIDVV